MEQVRAQLRMALDQRKFAVMEQPGRRRAAADRHSLSRRGRGARQPAAHLDGCVGGGLVQDLTAALELLAAQPLLRMETLALDRQRPENRLIEVKMKLSMLGAPR